MKSRLATLLLVAACTCAAADREFDRVVKAIEFHFSAKRTHIPFMGLANFVVKIGRPAGAKNFKLALFENLNALEDEAGIDRVLHELSEKGMRPLLRVRSRRNGQATLIFARSAGKDTDMLIATFDSNQATVVQMKVNVETLLKTLDGPVGRAVLPDDGF